MLFRKGWKARLSLVLAVVGPGFITANVDNDAGGIFTYSLAGAQFGYSLLWTMIPITVALVVVQEMASRMGAVTGKGRAISSARVRLPRDVPAHVRAGRHQLRQHRRGIRRRGEQPGSSSISRYIVVPLAAAASVAARRQGHVRASKKIFLSASAFYVCYIIRRAPRASRLEGGGEATVSRPSIVGIRTTATCSWSSA